MRKVLASWLFSMFFSTSASAYTNMDAFFDCIQNGYTVAAGGGHSASVSSGVVSGVTVYTFIFTDGISYWAPGLECYVPQGREDEAASRLPIPDRTDEQNSCGSIISPISRSVGEEIPVIGTPFKLVYSSKRGRRLYDYQIKTNICETDRAAGSTPDCKITYAIAGQSVNSSFDAVSSPATYDFTWDSLDNTSAKIYFPRTITVTYEALNLPSPLNNASDPIVRTYQLGAYDANFYGLGGWGIDVLHAYDPNGKVLYYGDGRSEYIDAIALGGGGYLVKPVGSSEVYEFNSAGRHVETKTALLGATIYTFSYNGSGHLTQISDAFGNDTIINRDGSGDLDGITGPYSAYTNVDLNGDGYIEDVTDPDSKVTNITYSDANGLIATFNRPGVAATEFTHTAEGLLLLDEHPSGRTLAYDFTSDPWPQVTETTSEGIVNTYTPTGLYHEDTGANQSHSSLMASGATSSYSQTYGVSTGRSNPDGTTTTYLEDDGRDSIWKQILSVARSTPGSTMAYTEDFTHSYNLASSDPFSVTDATMTRAVGANTFTMTFDAMTDTIGATSPMGRTYEYTIDAYERPVTVSIPNLTNIVYDYDPNGRLESITQGSRSLTYAYNGDGYLESVTDALSHETSYQYNDAGRVELITLPDTRTIAMTYDDRGNVTSVTTPNSEVTTITPTTWDLIEEFLPPAVTGISVPQTAYEYDLDQKLKKITRPDASEINYAYSSFTGKLDSVTTNEGTNYVTVNAAGRIDSTSLNGINTARTYDGPLTILDDVRFYNGVDFDYGTVEKGFDSEGRVNFMEVRNIADSSDLSVNFAYDNDGLLTDAGNVDLTYDPDNGKLTDVDNGNVHIDYTYNAYGDVQTYTAKYNTTTLYTYTLSYYNDGRIASKTETIQGTGPDTYTYDYDDAGRLEAVYKNLNPYSSYVYDANSNRTSGYVNGTAFSATYDEQDRIETWNVWNFAHNDNGERISKTHSGSMATTSYAYDSFGNILGASASGLARDYVLDGYGRRIGSMSSSAIDARYLYDGQYNLVGELDAANDVKKLFVYGSRSHVPDYYTDGTNDFMLITDHLGSVRLVVQVSNGSVVQRNDYDDLGGITYTTGSSTQPLRYAGGVYDPGVGFVHFGYRDYDPVTGRWISKDPSLFGGGDVNLYSYVQGNHVNLIDPSGLLPPSVWTGAVGALVGGTVGLYNSKSCTWRGRALDGLIGAGMGFGFGFLAGVGANAPAFTPGLLTLVGGVGVGAGSSIFDLYGPKGDEILKNKCNPPPPPPTCNKRD